MFTIKTLGSDHTSIAGGYAHLLNLMLGQNVKLENVESLKVNFFLQKTNLAKKNIRVCQNKRLRAMYVIQVWERNFRNKKNVFNENYILQIRR